MRRLAKKPFCMTANGVHTATNDASRSTARLVHIYLFMRPRSHPVSPSLSFLYGISILAARQARGHGNAALCQRLSNRSDSCARDRVTP